MFGSKVMLQLFQAVKKLIFLKKLFSFIVQTIEIKEKRGGDQGKVLEISQNLSIFSILLSQNFCHKITPFTLLQGSHCREQFYHRAVRTDSRVSLLSISKT